jgi:uncharacterized repeat protein (TIGR01451 family)
MKMKKILLACLLFTGWTQAQNITFKDPEFKKALLNNLNNHNSVFETLSGNLVESVDQNKDSEISIQEAEDIKSIWISEVNLLFVDEINNFKNLEKLYLVSTAINDLDISKLTKLKELICTNSNLISLDLSNNILLEVLNLSNSSKFTSIDLTKNIKLIAFNFSGTNILTIDFSKNIDLFGLSVSNKLKTLDLSNNHKIDSIHLTSSVEYANLKNGSTLSSIYFQKPNTHLYICADDQNIPSIINSVKVLNLSNVEVNSYCTFEPGGGYNLISNNIKYSDIGNCSGNNMGFPYIKFSIEDQFGKGNSCTDKEGNVQFYKQKGNFTLIPLLENPNYFKVFPETVNFKMPENSGHDTTINFCVIPNGNHKDVEVVLAPYGPARPGFDATYLVTYKNKGNQSLSGDVSIQYNEDVLDFVRSTMSTQTSGLISTSFLDLKPFEVRVDTLVLNVNSPIETPAVNINDTLKFIATINPINEDETPGDNVFKFNQLVVGAYDPNLVTCLQGHDLKPSEIGKTLHYTIEFENTGNYPAENIVVVEEIDPKKYDINSIQILNTSHPMKFRIEGNKVEYYFEKIQLGEHKHGNILLKLNSNDQLKEGAEVDKQANIYFDYNAPVQTNLEKTIYRDLKASIADLKEDESINVYPNPGNGLVKVNAAKNITSIEVYDVNGRVIQTKMTNASQVELHLSDEISGIYFIKVITQEGANVIKYQKD